jgi:hypothetical protein
MLDTLKAIGRGEVTVAFRRWKRPTVRQGGTLITPVGVLSIDSLDGIEPDVITPTDARAAGPASPRPTGPWTRRVLELIGERPGVRAGDLADTIGMERLSFKTDVRKLKALGLTESLEVGYRLSPRGQAWLAR